MAFQSAIRLLVTAAVLCGLAQGQTFPKPSCTRTTSPPPNDSGVPAICGQRGTVDDTYGYLSQTADNLQQCQNMCLRRQALKDGDGCIQFEYNQNTKLCKLHFYNWPFTPNAASPVTVTDARCFDCSKECPNTSNQNLLDLPYFETVNKYFGPWFSPDYINTTIGHPGLNSKNALYTSCDGARDGCPDGYNVFQTFNGCKGALYKAEFDYKVSFGTNSRPSLSAYTGDMNVFLDPPDLPNNQWKHFVSYFHAFGDADSSAARSVESLNFFIYDSNFESRPHYGVYIDNVGVTSITKDLTVPASSPQLVPNGNFETGKLGPWKIPSYLEGKVQVKKSNLNPSRYALVLSQPSISDLYIYQAAPALVAGVEYLVSLDYATDSPGAYIQLQLSSTHLIFRTVCNAYESCSGHLTWPIVAQTPGGQRGNLTVSAYFGEVDDPKVSTFTLDNVSIKRLSK